MAGKVIVITSGKGGVGKSTNTANLGTGLAMLGRKVVVVDADIGLRNLDMILGLENRIVYDLVNVIERQCKISQALIRDKRYKTLFLLPADVVVLPVLVGGKYVNLFPERRGPVGSVHESYKLRCLSLVFGL